MMTVIKSVRQMDGKRDEERRRLEAMLNAGLDDIEAGRVVSSEDVRREIAAKIDGHRRRSSAAAR